ncbi:putative metal ABC transporter, ATP-binding protein [Fibrobacter succinogenes subsp. succinogenes S85]|uniref:ABC transporter related protein n=1 Tax=Fibrobacter succinogenes (strain ATCC 19169 / S85) TaxID=59374 RepID=C9RQG0_FIBSS|nr:ATP-binding cassette domain-containing protein [Fibrobacter succinogenes]ACX74796.1 ABC transporter related protein [Fibrobacter succinogenes subsp. succinogenes S85]ADL24948.1 putative metal ABC transporter, ATP-binding protein [Fibrobacter succinogenes subsp. succinogenes S85]
MNNNLNTNSISQTKSPLLKCSNITLGYGSKNIVNNFNYTIHSGDYLSIIGRNGCGKTTFLRGLAGVLHPRAGKIELSSGLKRNQIGYLPQITVTQKDFPASVEEIVLSAFQGKNLLLPFYGKALRKRADECLELTHATNLRKESFRELSGGQKQRVLLARALCAAERLLLLDEPVTGLDPESSQNMYNIIKDLHENKNMTIVMVTHDIDAARNNSTRILNFNEIMQ